MRSQYFACTDAKSIVVWKVEARVHSLLDV